MTSNMAPPSIGLSANTVLASGLRRAAQDRHDRESGAKGFVGDVVTPFQLLRSGASDRAYQRRRRSRLACDRSARRVRRSR